MGTDCANNGTDDPGKGAARFRRGKAASAQVFLLVLVFVRAQSVFGELG